LFPNRQLEKFRGRDGMENEEGLVAGEMIGSDSVPITAELLGKGRGLANRLGAKWLAFLVGHGLSQASEGIAFYGPDRVYRIDHGNPGEFRGVDRLRV
jgi:hypothetical protein